MKVSAVVGDLMFASRIEVLLGQAGHDVTLVTDPEQVGSADVIVADLSSVEPEAVPTGTAPALGIYAHTRPDVRDRAMQAGFALAVPRSRFVREAAELVSMIAPPTEP